METSEQQTFMKRHDPEQHYHQGDLVVDDKAFFYYAVNDVPEKTSLEDKQYWSLLGGELPKLNLDPDMFLRPQKERRKRWSDYILRGDKARVKPLYLILACLVSSIFIVWSVFGAIGYFGFHVEIIVYAMILGFMINRAIILRMFGVSKVKGHTHQDEQGYLVRCYHKGTAVIRQPSFWIGMTAGYPLEHYLWEKMWPFYIIHDLLGL